MNKRSVRDLDVRDKRVLVRVDFNVPIKGGQVTDDTRIQRALPTIRYLLEEGARPILISHLGRPKGEPDPQYAMDPVAEKLEELLGDPVLKLSAAVGPEVEEALDDWDGRGVVLLENSRFYPGETKNDPEFSERLFVAILGGAKVSDKLGVIRSLLGVANTLLIGGAMCFTFFKAQGHEVGASLVEDDYLEEAK